jgi:hypothetical protein
MKHKRSRLNCLNTVWPKSSIGSQKVPDEMVGRISGAALEARCRLNKCSIFALGRSEGYGGHGAAS